ncbi:MAG: polyketide synthase, partial [Actinobacteria bacterium]|nr:polyketide synthase [Actinomycetota bacterium]
SLPGAIADRICGHFGFRGGGHVVDAAHSASLLAVASACSALAAGELDTAVAGGVDISLDPFELSGLAQLGVLATTGMRVYDARPTGFWPGEGCGLVVLMRAADARAAGLASYAQIMGWGMSSAGSPALSRPGSGSLLLALRRAYERAGIAPEDVQLIEGDGTGTGSGDLAELTSLAEIRGGAPGLAAIGSVKANIGHAKAAAGIAGLIKTVLSIAAGVIPPGTGCVRPHPLIASEEARLRVPAAPEPWPARTRLAGVSSVGPGGSSVHVVLRRDVGSGPRRRVQLPGRYAAVTGGNRHRARRGAAARAARPGAERAGAGKAAAGRAETSGRLAIPVPATPPRTEPFVFSGPDRAAVTRELTQVAAVAPWLSDAELGDLAWQLGSRDASGPVRAGLAARSQDELARLASGAAELLRDLAPGRLTADAGIYAAEGAGGGVTLLFPGEPETTSLTSSLASLRWLAALGVTARAGAGHGLGELAGLAWAGCLSEPDAERLAAELSDAEEPSSSAALAGLGLSPPARRLYPGSTGRELTADEDPRALLGTIPAAPERFSTAVGLASAGSDLLVETGPGPDLARLAAGHCHLPAVSLPGSWDDPDAVADAAAALFAAGAVPGLAPLFAGRPARPIDIWRERTFITNPCEMAWPAAAALPAPRRDRSAGIAASAADTRTAGARTVDGGAAGTRTADVGTSDRSAADGAEGGAANSPAADGAASDGPGLDSPASTNPDTNPASTRAGGAAAHAVSPQQVTAAPARLPAIPAPPPVAGAAPPPAPAPPE